MKVSSQSGSKVPSLTYMIPIFHSKTRKRPPRWALILLALLCIMAVCCSPALGARDVRVALTELRPSLFTDEQGNPSGFFVDLIEDLAKKEGWKVIWMSGTLSESWERLSRGDIDLMPAVTVTPERLILYDFTNESVLSIWSQVYARPDSGINTILDLEGKRVAMVRGASSGVGLRDYAEKFGVNPIFLEKDTPADIFTAVSEGEADALVMYNSAGQEEVKEYGLTTTPVMFNPAQFGFATLKGKNQDLIRAIDPYIAESKKNPSSIYSMSMQRWYSISAEEIIPAFLWWILGGIASLASLFVIMSYLLRREVRRKTAELATQNEELVRKNEELRAAYDQLSAMDEELRDNFYQLKKSENALIQARKKLNLLNKLTGQDIRNAFFNLAGFIQISKESESFDEAKVYFEKEEEILHSVQENLSFLEKYQNLGINQPRWQNFVYVLLSAISHLDLSHISRTINLPDIEIFTDPLLEDAFLALMDTIARQGDQITRIGLSCQKNADTITIIIESDGPGIPANEKEQVFKWEYMGKNGTSLFLAREILSITDISLEETGEAGTGIRFEITIPESEFRIIEKND